ncbi:MAG: bacillithiol system redox-active protein YtxJ, partial [Bacteroidota bacterium]|nr:bacillithiol system redox-active protein YtxJ [Candidatus Kapabacteria bacterium]MDW8220449.1 bacillithiol system redox-active protein YtxJ [Bacteroidota bacterium]
LTEITMTQAHELTSIADLDKALEESRSGLALFFKHSATCDISAAAWEEFLDFLRDNTMPLHSYFLIVQTARPVSNEIESRFGIRHESPQAILLCNGQPVWHDSHRRLTTEIFRSKVIEYAATTV